MVAASTPKGCAPSSTPWVAEAVKVELKKLTPTNYIGDAQRLVDLCWNKQPT